jgi:formylglycine-generating enzyme required for sulfatase activity
VDDWYRPDTYARRAGQALTVNPSGPPDSLDPQEPYASKRVIRGGSFLCNDSYCTGYRPSARMKIDPLSGLSHTGFRCVATSAMLRGLEAKSPALLRNRNVDGNAASATRIEP